MEKRHDGNGRSSHHRFSISTNSNSSLCSFQSFLSLIKPAPGYDITFFRPSIASVLLFITMNIIKLLLLAVLALGLFPCANAGICSNMDLNRNEYACGKNYYEPDYFTQNPATTDDCRCCCRDEDGGGFHLNTCDGGGGNPFRSVPKGCGACMGDDACREALNSKIGDNSCVGDEACHSMMNSKIKPESCQGKLACRTLDNGNVGNNSCQGNRACYDADNTQVGDRSCQGFRPCRVTWGSNIKQDSCQGDWACMEMDNTQVGDRSCHGDGACRQLLDSTVGNDSCQGDESCYQYGSSDNGNGYGNRVTIGSNACNLFDICRECEDDSVVPDFACNGDKFDWTLVPDKATLRPTCNYCRVSSKYTTSIFDCVSLFSSQSALLSPLISIQNSELKIIKCLTTQ